MPMPAEQPGRPRVELLLNSVIGCAVRGSDRRIVGRLADVAVSVGDGSGGPPGRPRVSGLLVRRRGMPRVMIPWPQCATFGPDTIGLFQAACDRGCARPAGTTLGDDEILLVRDVLDTQVVDLAGQRLARVADVVLVGTGDQEIELVAVDVGAAALLRRLGLRRLADRVRSSYVPWGDLHLMSDRGHLVALRSPRSAVHHLDARGLARLLSTLDTDSAAQVLTLGDPHIAAGAVRAAHPEVGERVLRAMPRAEASRVLEAMPPSPAAHWRDRLARRPRRPVGRSRVWPRRRYPPADEAGK